jgi:hypothetical protein
MFVVRAEIDFRPVTLGRVSPCYYLLMLTVAYGTARSGRILENLCGHWRLLALL